MCGRTACNCDEGPIIAQANAIRQTAGQGSESLTQPNLVNWLHRDRFQPYQCNISPSEQLTVIRSQRTTNDCSSITIETCPWGISLQGSTLVINARAEGIHSNAFFKNGAFHRCILCVTGYMEWFTPSNGKAKKEPFYFYDRQAREQSGDSKKTIKPHILRAAAVQESSGKVVIVTTAASTDVAWCHDRMPALFTSDRDAWDWIDPSKSMIEAQAMLKPVNGLLAWHRLRPNFAQLSKERMIKDENGEKRAEIASDTLREYTPTNIMQFFGSKRKYHTVE